MMLKSLNFKIFYPLSMKLKASFLFATLTLILSISANSNPHRDTVLIKAEELEQKVIEWRRDIHKNPELSNREFKTAEKVAKHLKSLGIEVQTGVAHTGVVGLIKGALPGPVVALRADMDALPVTERTPVPYASEVKTMFEGNEVGVMHACGHDTHVAILMGVAEILAGLKDDMKGSVKLIFQPAEEGAPKGEEGGAELMVEQGVMENPKVDAVFGLHVKAKLEVGKLTYKPEGFFASVSDMKITVKGQSAHGAYPWFSKDPIVASAQIINNLQTVVSRNVNVTENAAVVTIGSIHGGNRSNIIPEQVEMKGTVRTLSPTDEKMVMERIRTIVENTAEAMGVEVDLELPYSHRYPVTYNDPALTQMMLPSMQKSAGSENVELVPAITGAEDFAFLAQEAPGLFIRLGGMPKGMDPKDAAPHHTPDFFIDDSGLKLGVITMANLALDYQELNQ
jgi:amidohydrolase